MQPSPLVLVNYFLTDLQVKAHREFDPEADTQHSAELSAAVETFQQNDLWGCTLTVGVASKESMAPYTVSLTLMGFFTVVDTYPVDKIDELVNVGAPSILFGAAREVIASVTARGPYDTFILPSSSFANVPKEATAHTEKQLKGQAKARAKTAGQATRKNSKTPKT